MRAFQMLGVALLAGGAHGQTVADCQRCINMAAPCYQGSWAEPCYPGGGSAAACTGAGAVWCPNMGGTSPAPPPTSAPPTLPPPPSAQAADDSRMIAYVGNWQACPSDATMNAYTHVLVSFAVTYTWAPNKNQCNQQCQITAPVPVCGNSPQPALVQKWRQQGKKVILSFGGAGMGGSWDGLNDCWEYCYGKEAYVIQQLVDIAKDQGFDGVDIDYEYYYENGQKGSSFSKGAQAQGFLRDVTVGLKQQLPAGSIVTHAPMDVDLVQGTGYYNVIKQVASSMDFIMPQYYNGVTRPNTDGINGGVHQSALAHFTKLVTDCFSNDPTRVVFGFCINDCGGTGSNINTNQAVSVMNDLKTAYPCNGGAFFWVANDDVNGVWSQVVAKSVAPYRGCSSGSTPTTNAPAPVTSAPVPKTTAPIPVTSAPVPVTNAPVPKTNAPIPATNAPAPVTSAPVPKTNAPVPVTSAPVPVTSAPAPVTSAPAPVTPVPQSSCNQPNRIERWQGCKQAPNCCKSGLVCHYRTQWYSQCDVPTNPSPTIVPAPVPVTSVPVPPTSAPVPATDAPTPKPPTSTPTPTDAPTPSPPTTPAPPVDNACPAGRIEQWGGCLSNPNCCNSGMACYKSTQWWARCLRVCNYAPQCELISN